MAFPASTNSKNLHNRLTGWLWSAAVIILTAGIGGLLLLTAQSEVDPALAAAPPPNAPIVVQTVPEKGVEQPLEAPLEIRFDQPMDRASVEKAFAIEPGDPVDGQFDWVDDQTVRFAFKNGFSRGERYRVRVVETAKSQAGVEMLRPFEWYFSAAGFLEVVNTQPVSDTTEVLAESTVTVFFNRPVATLGNNETPNPLTFVPPVTGKGQWLNTAIYQFTPDPPGFAPATDYLARVARGVTDVTGQAVLERDYEWRFSTISPAVSGSLPTNNDQYVSPTPVISVSFNQKMDRADVEKNLTLINESTAEPVPGQLTWAEAGLIMPLPVDEYGNPLPEVDQDGNPKYDPNGQPILPQQKSLGVETVVFTPDEPLTQGAVYQIILPTGVKGALAGTKTMSDYNASFTVIPAPAVLSTNPAQGERFADPYQGLSITFSGPMDQASIMPGETLLVGPDITTTDVYTYWSQNDTQLNVNFPSRGNSAYTVTLTTGIKDRYGQPLLADMTINWETLNQSPYVYFVSPSIATYNGYQAKTYVYLTVRNTKKVDFELYRLSQDEFLRLSENVFGGWDDYNQWADFQPDPAKQVGKWSQATNPEAFINTVYKVDVSQAIAKGQPLPPGLYYLVASAPANSIYPEAQTADASQAIDRQLLIVSKRALTLKQGVGDGLAWLTDLQSGRPVARTPLSVLVNQQPADQVQTDNEGVAQFTFTQLSNDLPAALVVFAGTPDKPDDNFAVAASAWNAGITAYDFNNLYPADYTGFRSTGAYNGYVYAERPLYRPGQTVHFKAILRADNDANYSLPSVPTATVQIFDGQYRQVYTKTLSLNKFGTLNDSLKLSENAGLGGYSIQVLYEGVTLYGSFDVAAYRKPEYLVQVLTDKPEYRQGDTVKVSVSAEFFSGGPVSQAPVRWTLLSDPYPFQYQGPGNYDFIDTDDPRRASASYYAGYGERIADGQGVTDAEGRFTFEVPADIANRLASQTFTFDVAVTDLNNQEVAAQAKTIVHKGDFYVGLRPKQYVGQAGVDNPIEVLVVNWRDNGKPVANQEVELVAAEYNWYSVQQLNPESQNPDDQYYWENLVEDKAVFSTTVTTDKDGLAQANFTPAKAGNYKIYARAIDRSRQEIHSATYLWVSGSGYVNWGQENNDRIELVTDQRQYQVGDTAQILIPHPFSGTVTALVTLERGHIYRHFLTELKTNSDRIQIPITKDSTPNIFVSVVVVKGMDTSLIDEGGAPGFRLGYVRLPVAPKEKELTITLTPTSPQAGEVYQPGDTVDYQVKVTDVQGKPVKAELSLALIDKAVLALAPDKPGQLLDAFWFERTLNVQTASGLTLALDRINRSLDEKKGGGGGGAPGLESVRQNFADTALWVADFVTDEKGQGQVTAILPDNLTTWVLIGKGVTGADTLVGESRVEVVSSKPLLVRSVTPRFFVIGDEAVLGMIIQNNSDTAQEAEVSFTAEGLAIGDWRLADGEWSGQGTPKVTVKAGERVKVEYKVKVGEAETARLTMGAKSAALGDAVAFELPIYHLSTPETVATGGIVAEDGTRLEGIALPRSFDPAQGGLTVNLDPSLAAGMQAGLRYLEHYPHECIEQTVSRFLPNIFTFRAYKKVGLTPPNQEAAMDLVGEGLQRIYSQQHVDGGWGWWSQDVSDPNLTAYVLLGLAEARHAGLAVDQSVIDSAIAYLQASLVAPKDIAAPWQGNQQAFGLYALAEAGSGDFSRSAALFERREMLDAYGRAFLAMSMYLTDPQAKQIDTLLADLTGAAIVSATGAHWEEETVDYRAMNTDTRSTAIVMAALSRIQPDNPVLPQAVRWLMSIRQNGGHWETTQETAWAIIGLTDWLAASGELSANYAWAASLNGHALGQGQADKTNLTETTQLQVSVRDLLTDAVNRLAIERDSAGKEKAGSLYYTAYLTTYKPIPEVKALDRGIAVSRQYFLQPPTPSHGEGRGGIFPSSSQGEGRGGVSPSPSHGEGRGGGPTTEASVGDFIQVKLTIVAPNDLHYVLIEDPYPAGLEGVDSSLATTSVVGQPPTDPAELKRGYGWWYFSHSELRDDKAVLFATYLPKGVYEYTYSLRAATPGTFQVIPTHAEEMYFPEVFGRSDGGVFKVK